jgi:hypothetical protein
MDMTVAVAERAAQGAQAEARAHPAPGAAR